MPALSETHFGYFSMEIGISDKIPTYSGGLGVLAGDTLRSAADTRFPLVGVTLLANYGYFFQTIKDDKQVENAVSWSIDDFLELVDVKTAVNISGEEVKIRCWKYEIEGLRGYKLPVYFLDTNFEGNSDKARDYTGSLYGGGTDYRLAQEIILGVGGVRMLQELGYGVLEKYHMNEGHSALLALELHRILGDLNDVKSRCIFTTHTPVSAGHDQFELPMVKEMLDEELFNLLPATVNKHGKLNMTALALESSNYINGVAKKHAQVSRKRYPRYPIHSITNGVHTRTWVAIPFEELYDQHLQGWREYPHTLINAPQIPLDKLWAAHNKCKKRIIDFTNAHTNSGLHYDLFTIGWARRFTSYKRPEFLFTDIERLKNIAEKHGPIQVIYGGKAHPRDDEGKELVEKIIKLSRELKGKVNLAYISNYDMYLAKLMTSGVDAWLNTPQPPYEASGTSGMKCAMNGIPHISVADGWWLEGCVPGKTGWTFSQPEDLYGLLENEILPAFYEDHWRWCEIMQNTIMINGSHFNTHRMLNEYIHLAYDRMREHISNSRL
jgi:glycogen phosphorylase